MKVKYIVMKMIDCTSLSLDSIASMGGDNFTFMKMVMDNAHDGKFIAGDCKTKMCSSLGMSHTTFWKRIKVLEDRGLMKKSSRGIYNLNKNWLRVFTFEPGEKEKNLVFKI